ncbi:MAG: hypothetical protein ACK5HT_20995, partial [Draconibacterium sp.]
MTMHSYFTKVTMLVLAFFLTSFSNEEVKKKLVKVACVGDSITFGARLNNPDQHSYPAQLQLLLGKKYQVENFGVGGSTLL